MSATSVEAMELLALDVMENLMEIRPIDVESVEEMEILVPSIDAPMATVRLVTLLKDVVGVIPARVASVY